MIRKAKAVWRGTGREGDGDLSTDSGVLSETPYSYRTRFENEKGTNPEELLAAAHAGCFTMALAFQLQGAGYEPTELTTEAAVSLEPEGQGFRITRSALTLRASVPTLDEATFLKLAEQVFAEFRPHVMLTYGGLQVSLELMARARRRGIAVVFFLRNLAYNDRRFFDNTTAVLVPSEFSRRHYAQLLGLASTALPDVPLVPI